MIVIKTLIKFAILISYFCSLNSFIPFIANKRWLEMMLVATQHGFQLHGQLYQL